MSKEHEEHTPGPWRVGDGWLFASWGGAWRGIPASVANLRLMAAAPDLLAALEALANDRRVLEAAGHDSDTQAVLDAAFAAAAKARERSP